MYIAYIHEYTEGYLIAGKNNLLVVYVKHLGRNSVSLAGCINNYSIQEFTKSGFFSFFLQLKFSQLQI